MATLLPNGKQVFLDANGAPLAGGSVQFFIPGTTTPKDTYQDAGATILNSNPVVLDAAGRATIYGTGAYRQIVRDASGNTIWDQNTLDTSSSASSWASHSAGTANAQTVAAPSFTSSDGQSITFIASATNTAALSLNVNGIGGIAVLKDGATGPTALSGGEVVSGNVVTVTYDATLGSFHLNNRAAPGYAGSIASAATTDIGAVGNNTLSITGTNAITSFGTSASLGAPIFFVSFAASLTITYNSTSLITPGATNIITSAGDQAILLYLGSGNWRVAYYQRATTLPGGGAPANPQNLKIAVTGDTAATLTADSAVVTDGTSYIPVSAVSRTLGTGATGVDGLDTGTVANSTWYSVWIIAKYDGTQGGLLSTSATSPTLPTGYTLKTRVGWVRTDSSGKLLRTLQRNKTARYVVTAATNTAALPLLGTGTAGNYTTPTWVAISVSTFVPNSAISIAIVANASSGGGLIVAPNNSYGAYNSTTNSPPVVIVLSNVNPNYVTEAAPVLLESTNIYWAATTAQLYCNGWEDV